MLGDVGEEAEEGNSGTPWGLCAMSALPHPPRAQPGESGLTEMTHLIVSCAESHLRLHSPLSGVFWPHVLLEGITGTRSPCLIPGWKGFVRDCASSALHYQPCLDWCPEDTYGLHTQECLLPLGNWTNLMTEF